jgi:NAD-dependent dihydropyrimidine dehydrogenase PreA subunit
MALAMAGIFLPRRNDEKTSSLFSDVVTPPGSTGVEHLLSACTGCQLCISHCPTGVLQASLFEYGLEGFMAPHLSFKNSGCSYDCNACSDSCPTGAIRPISLADKQRTRLGIPIRDSAKCSQQVDGKECSTCIDSCPVGAWKQRKEGNLTWDDGCCSQCMNCVQVCPTQAISAVQKSTSSWKTIEINTEKCIGCGRCIQHCEGGALSFSKSTTNSRLPRLDGAVCIGCGTCVANCPNQSLQMRALKKHEVARPSRFSHN